MATAPSVLSQGTGEPRPDDANHDLNLVIGAVDLVAAGGARRVTLVGLRSSARLLPLAQTISSESGLRARGSRNPDGSGYDITVEALA